MLVVTIKNSRQSIKAYLIIAISTLIAVLLSSNGFDLGMTHNLKHKSILALLQGSWACRPNSLGYLGSTTPWTTIQRRRYLDLHKGPG